MAEAEFIFAPYNFLDNGAGDLMLVLFDCESLSGTADDDNAQFVYDGFKEAMLIRNSEQIIYLPVIAEGVHKMLTKLLGKVKTVLVTEVEGEYTNDLDQLVKMAKAYDDCYQTPVTIEKKSKPMLQALAAEGNAAAQYFLAHCYYEGETVEQNYAKAFEWFRRAAEQDHVLAQTNLGACYAMGEGVATDPVQAAFWLNKAAAQGNIQAKYTLAKLQQQG